MSEPGADDRRAPAGRPREPRLALLRGGQRVRAEGKFLRVGGETLHVRGATYGAFRPDEEGVEFHDAALIERDFAAMAAAGMNAVRIPHTTPPPSLLDAASRHGLRVMVGLSVEQLLGYEIDRKGRDAYPIESVVRAKVRSVAGHPALLCFAIGNEIPASVVRWFGRHRVERFLAAMARIVEEEDPDALVTYVNYPTTEYLDLPFLDLLCFNVYLEDPERLSAYLAHLQVLAGDRPLLMSELGLDSLRHGELAQARSIDWQIRRSFAAGCAGAFVFAWTDDWYRGDAAVDDWRFGLTDRERRPKPALAAASAAFADAPLPDDKRCPPVSVVVCTRDGARTLDDCCRGLCELDYPDYEVLVVDDGSTDGSAKIAERYGWRVIRTEPRGLGTARNTGWQAARGEIVAYLDDDARPDPLWLRYLAHAFASSGHAAIGGPNVSPVADTPFARLVAQAPGNPTHVLLSDDEAEHLPGCNMAFRREALAAVGGFDPRFQSAGDDVDVCWRLRERGDTLGFCAPAMVWHRRRGTLKAYLAQQLGYGRAEAMLADKWRQRGDGFGRLRWLGTLYGSRGGRLDTGGRPRVYHGVWGAAPFQSLYAGDATRLGELLRLPGFQALVAVLLALTLLGVLWAPLRLAALPLGAALAAMVAEAVRAARRAPLPIGGGRLARIARRSALVGLHLLQPAARLAGWIAQRRPPRRWWSASARLPRAQACWLWSQRWQEPADRLHALELALSREGLRVEPGGAFEGWDLELQGGPLARLRVCAASEDSGGGQLLRLRCWPRFATGLVPSAAVLAGLAGLAAADGAVLAAGLLGLAAGVPVVVALWAAACATSGYALAVERLDADARSDA